jgi:hypothetical protein
MILFRIAMEAPVNSKAQRAPTSEAPLKITNKEGGTILLIVQNVKAPIRVLFPNFRATCQLQVPNLTF